MRRAVAALLICVSLAAILGCGSDKQADDDRNPYEGPRTEEDDYRNFLRAVENADDQGYTPYWFGQNPTFGGVTFYGPSMPDFGTELEGRIDFSYDPSLDDAGGSLNVSLLADSVWEQSGYSRPVGDRIVKTIDTTVLGAPAKVILIAAGARPINATRVTMQIGDTHIVVTAQSGGSSSSGGPDSNPLIYEKEFLEVMQQLRPYPE